MNHDRIVSAAMSLRAMSPELWEQFVFAIREASAQTTSDMARCPPELLLRAQGMAIMMQELVQVLVEAPKLHETLRGKHGQERNFHP